MPKYVVQRLNPWSDQYTDVGARAKHLADTPFPADLYQPREAPGAAYNQAQELAGRTGGASPYQYIQSLKQGADLAKRATGPTDMHAYMMPYLAHVGEEMGRSMRRGHEPIAQEINKKFNAAHPKSLHKDLPARLNRDLEKEIDIQKQLAAAQGWESSIQLSQQDELRKLLGAELLGKQGVHAQESHVYNLNTLNKAAQLARSEEVGAREHSLNTGMKILGYPFDLLNRYNRIVRGLPLEYSIKAIGESRMPIIDAGRDAGRDAGAEHRLMMEEAQRVADAAQAEGESVYNWLRQGRESRMGRMAQIDPNARPTRLHPPAGQPIAPEYNVSVEQWLAQNREREQRLQRVADEMGRREAEGIARREAERVAREQRGERAPVPVLREMGQRFQNWAEGAAQRTNPSQTNPSRTNPLLESEEVELKRQWDEWNRRSR